MNRTTGDPGNRECAVNRCVDSVASHLIARDDGNAPGVNAFHVVHRVGELRDSDLDDARGVGAKFFHEAPDG